MRFGDAGIRFDGDPADKFQHRASPAPAQGKPERVAEQRCRQRQHEHRRQAEPVKTHQCSRRQQHGAGGNRQTDLFDEYRHENHDEAVPQQELHRAMHLLPSPAQRLI